MGFFTIFIAPIAGVLISEAVRKLVHRRRSRLLFQLTALAAVIGSLPLLVIFASSYLAFPVSFTIYRILPLVWQGLYTVLIGSSVYYRLTGFKV
jgi:hypothetical protein